MTPITETIIIAVFFCITLMLLGVAFLVYMARGGRMFTIRVTGPAGTSIIIGESEKSSKSSCPNDIDGPTDFLINKDQ